MSDTVIPLCIGSPPPPAPSRPVAANAFVPTLPAQTCATVPKKAPTHSDHPSTCSLSYTPVCLLSPSSFSTLQHATQRRDTQGYQRRKYIFWSHATCLHENTLLIHSFCSFIRYSTYRIIFCVYTPGRGVVAKWVDFRRLKASYLSVLTPGKQKIRNNTGMEVNAACYQWTTFSNSLILYWIVQIHFIFIVLK